MSMLFKFMKALPYLLKGNVITLVLVILKMTGVVSWSWWAVTTLLWLPFALLFSILLLLPVLGIFGAIFSTSKSSTINGITTSYKRKNSFSKWKVVSVD